MRMILEMWWVLDVNVFADRWIEESYFDVEWYNNNPIVTSKAKKVRSEVAFHDGNKCIGIVYSRDLWIWLAALQ